MCLSAVYKYHSHFLGTVSCWGMGTSNQLSKGDDEDAWAPVKMSGKQLENRYEKIHVKEALLISWLREPVLNFKILTTVNSMPFQTMCKGRVIRWLTFSTAV